MSRHMHLRAVLGTLLLTVQLAAASDPALLSLRHQMLAPAAAPAPAPEDLAPAPSPLGADPAWYSGGAGEYSVPIDLRGADAPPALPIPSMPYWAEAAAEALLGGGDAEDKPLRRNCLKRNRKVVEQANAAGQRMDIAWYGDSITALLFLKHQQLWDDTWAGLAAASLGVPGAKVEDVAYLLASGRQDFDQDPGVIILLIGINNSLESEPATKLDWLLGWLAAAHPTSKVVVLLPLPARRPKPYSELRREYRDVVSDHPSVTLSECGGDFDPSDNEQTKDGLHPEAPGYRHILDCLAPQVDDLLDDSKAEAAAMQLAAMQLAGAAAP